MSCHDPTKKVTAHLPLQKVRAREPFANDWPGMLSVDPWWCFLEEKKCDVHILDQWQIDKKKKKLDFLSHPGLQSGGKSE